MKLSIILAATVTADKFHKKEWEVQDAYFADQEVILSDPAIRSNKQWHECGDKPALAQNGRDVKCWGAYCASVCPQGYRSQGRWKIKCKADNTWAHSRFSPCISCPSMDAETANINAQVQNIFVKNLPVTQFFCGDSSDQLTMNGQLFKNGGKKRSVKCMCRNGQNGDPAWKKSCSWEFQDQPWEVAYSANVMCYDQDVEISYKPEPAYSCEHPADHARHPQNPQGDPMSCKPGFVIRVNSATYGKPAGSTMCIADTTDHKPCNDSADHTERARRHCDGQETCVYHGKNQVAGDPCQGVAKHTVLDYTCVQPSYSYSNQAFSCEAAVTGPTDAKLRCAPGKKIKVGAAVYGRTDEAHCPSEKDTICENTVDHTGAVAAACDGKRSCSYHGTNKLGDPCKGSHKFTHIHYTCE